MCIYTRLDINFTNLFIWTSSQSFSCPKAGNTCPNIFIDKTASDPFSKNNFWLVNKNIINYILIGNIHYVFDEICC
jgi:hypothetical protein